MSVAENMAGDPGGKGRAHQRDADRPASRDTSHSSLSANRCGAAREEIEVFIETMERMRRTSRSGHATCQFTAVVTAQERHHAGQGDHQHRSQAEQKQEARTSSFDQKAGGRAIINMAACSSATIELICSGVAQDGWRKMPRAMTTRHPAVADATASTTELWMKPMGDLSALRAS